MLTTHIWHYQICVSFFNLNQIQCLDRSSNLHPASSGSMAANPYTPHSSWTHVGACTSWVAIAIFCYLYWFRRQGIIYQATHTNSVINSNLIYSIWNPIPYLFCICCYWCMKYSAFVLPPCIYSLGCTRMSSLSQWICHIHQYDQQWMLWTFSLCWSHEPLPDCTGYAYHCKELTYPAPFYSGAVSCLYRLLSSHRRLKTSIKRTCASLHSKASACWRATPADSTLSWVLTRIYHWLFAQRIV